MPEALRCRCGDESEWAGANAVTAVNQVSFSVMPGEFVALVGPSGSGKTTLLAMLAGLLSPTDGEILIGGEPLGEFSEAQRTRFQGRDRFLVSVE